MERAYSPATRTEETPPPAWKAAGWDRAPRNGRERKQAAAGDPPPEIQVKACRKCGGVDFTVRKKRRGPRNKNPGEIYLTRCCLRCIRASRTRYRKKRAAAGNEVRERWRTAIVPRDPDGPTEVCATWVHYNGSELATRASEGETFLVTRDGAAMYYVMPVTQYMKVQRR